MTKRRMINTKFWADNYIVELDPLERYLFLYFLTNEHTNIAGIYELPMRTMAFETGLDKEMLDKMLPRFKGKIFYVSGWVYIKNFPKHQIYNDSVKIGIEKTIKEIPEDILAKIKQLDTDCGQSGIRVGSGCLVFKPESKSKSESKLKSKVINYSPKSLELSKLLYKLIKDRNPDWYVDPNFDKWAEDIDKIIRLDGRTAEQVEWMIKWVQKDEFWSQNVLSPSKLREKFNTLVVRAKADKKGGITII